MIKPFVIENCSPVEQAHWVFVALPPSQLPNGIRPQYAGGWVRDANGSKWPWVACDHGIRVFASVAANTKMQFECLPEEADPYLFTYHPVLAAGLANIVPEMWLGALPIPLAATELVESSAAHQIWKLRWLEAQSKVSVVLWATVHTQTSTVEFVTHAVYGTVANDGQSQTTTLPELVMTSGAEIFRDFAVRNGQSQATRTPRHWSLTLVPAGRWHRAVRHETRGALLPVPDATRRLGLPMQGLSVAWDGEWMALGKVPVATPDAQQARVGQYGSYVRPQPGSYTMPRPRCQPRESGTTGEQPDFGAASDLAVTMENPWEIHDALWQCQSYAQRPTCNREPDGTPMRAELHPLAQTMNQRPDLSYGQQDRLGWPGVNQIQWIPSATTCLWTTSDDQHRADNFLHATYALTRDPALGAIIYDHVQLDATDIYTRTGWVPAPRAVGRMALTRANQVWLGFTEAKAALVAGLGAAASTTPYATLPPKCEVRTIGGKEQAKYGWNDSTTGQPIIGWQPWQEAIACIGFAAAARVLDHDVYTDVALDLANLVTAEGFRIRDNVVEHAYAVRWNNGFRWEEHRWPSASGYSDASTDFIFRSTACLPWSLAACQYVPATAAHILKMFPLPKTASEARWRAMP